ncbi:bone morphogenetic protein 10-like [Styela clava]
MKKLSPLCLYFSFAIVNSFVLENDVVNLNMNDNEGHNDSETNQDLLHQLPVSSGGSNHLKKRSVDFDNYFDEDVDNPFQNSMPRHMAVGVRPPVEFDSFFGENPKSRSKPLVSPVISSSNENVVVPQFMLDLFNRFDQDKSMQPTSNIIRSFPNKATMKHQLMFNSQVSDCDRNPHGQVCVTKRLLLFNISSIPLHEQITQAELRFHLVLKQFRWPAIGVDIKIEIIEVNCHNLKSNTWREDSNRFCKQDELDIQNANRRVIDTRQQTVRRDGWETFEITGAMQSWIRRKKLHQLEVHITMMDTTDGIIDIDPDPASPREPLLVVFSDDTSRNRHLEHRDEMREMLAHQTDKSLPVTPVDFYEFGTVDYKRKRRSIIDRDIDIEVGGIKVPVKLRDPEDAAPLASKRREKRSTSHGPHCHKADMYVNFHEIGFDWITKPTGYKAYKCIGTCELPLTGDTTKHATIQAAAHLRFPSLHKSPCCVPTKLEPISLLYYVEPGVIEYKYQYGGMRVSECGCR